MGICKPADRTSLALMGTRRNLLHLLPAMRPRFLWRWGDRKDWYEPSRRDTAILLRDGRLSLGRIIAQLALVRKSCSIGQNI